MALKQTANGRCEVCTAPLPDQKRRTCRQCAVMRRAARNSIEPVPLASYREACAFQAMKQALADRGVDLDADRDLTMAMNEWVISVFLRAREEASS